MGALEPFNAWTQGKGASAGYVSEVGTPYEVRPRLSILEGTGAIFFLLFFLFLTVLGTPI